jgi:hypothetical protein
MKFTSHPKKGDKVKLDFIVERIVSKVQKQTGRKIYYLYVQKDGEKRILGYNPRLMQTDAAFERYSGSFGGSSKGNYKSW